VAGHGHQCVTALATTVDRLTQLFKNSVGLLAGMLAGPTKLNRRYSALALEQTDNELAQHRVTPQSIPLPGSPRILVAPIGCSL